MKLRAILFDFDGTLVDSEPLHCRLWQTLLAGYGVRFTEADYREQLLGVPSDRSARVLVERFALPLTPVALLAERDRALENRLATSPPPLMPHARTTLNALCSQGLRLCLVTASHHQAVTRVLDAHALSDRFELWVTGDDVAHPKPHPEGYRQALDRLGLTPDQAMAVEDSPTGIEAARGAGLPCLAIESPYSPAEKLSRATRVLDHLGAARDWILTRQR